MGPAASPAPLLPSASLTPHGKQEPEAALAPAAARPAVLAVCPPPAGVPGAEARAAPSRRKRLVWRVAPTLLLMFTTSVMGRNSLCAEPGCVDTKYLLAKGVQLAGEERHESSPCRTVVPRPQRRFTVHVPQPGLCLPLLLLSRWNILDAPGKVCTCTIVKCLVMKRFPGARGKLPELNIYLGTKSDAPARPAAADGALARRRPRPSAALGRELPAPCAGRGAAFGGQSCCARRDGALRQAGERVSSVPGGVCPCCVQGERNKRVLFK